MFSLKPLQLQLQSHVQSKINTPYMNVVPMQVQAIKMYEHHNLVDKEMVHALTLPVSTAQQAHQRSSSIHVIFSLPVCILQIC